MVSEEQAVAAARCWVEQVVIKHNFCPFAHKPARNNTIGYVACLAQHADALVEDLIKQLLLLRDADHGKIETIILVAPNCLQGFDDYNQFLDVVDVLINQFNLQGIIQVASFHPDYQFADLDKDDVRNYTNRSPYPMFHLILEDSIAQARETYPDVDQIPENNMRLLRAQGLDQAKQQLAGCLKDK
ncbi:MAG TPA: DUF1415 domain-containing protein [Candidatus Tenderia electrophaga]|uniref:DUF1415 domain-containing protein n=1 Tax=Candidatus Tenderia electrophaga TaxID=1748243 RepID=A0A832N3U8_9GAMM|nr:DUF1415 domain-containing protein [Candidatus Tenderia electrophaga]